MNDRSTANRLFTHPANIPPVILMSNVGLLASFFLDLNLKPHFDIYALTTEVNLLLARSLVLAKDSTPLLKGALDSNIITTVPAVAAIYDMMERFEKDSKKARSPIIILSTS